MRDMSMRGFFAPAFAKIGPARVIAALRPLVPVMLIGAAVVFAVQPIWLGMSSDLPSALKIVGLQAWPWLVLAPGMWWFTHRVQIDAVNWRRTLPLHALMAIAVVATYALLWYQPLLHGWVQPPMPNGPMGNGGPRSGMLAPRPSFEGGERSNFNGRPPPSRPEFRSEAMLLRQARGALPVYLVLVAGAHAFLYYRRSVERGQRVLQAEAQVARTRLFALQSQLQPHFLFNSLNAASSLVYTQPAEADRMLCEIAEFLRAVLAASSRPAVSLREEIELLGKYTAIQRIRYPRLLTVDFDVDADVAEAVVPTLVLQPLVENAVKHGIGQHGGAGRVEIVARRHGLDLAITVIDQLLDGDGGPRARVGQPGAPAGVGLGLVNIRERLDVWTGGRFRFDVQALKAPQVGTRVLLMVPLTLSPEHV